MIIACRPPGSGTRDTLPSAPAVVLPTTSAPGAARVATRFRVAEARIVELERYDALATALQAAGLTAADRVPPEDGERAS